MIAVCISLSAQNTYDNSRRTVLLDDVSGTMSQGVRYYLMEAMAKTKRVNLYDGRMYNNIPQSIREKIKIDAIFSAVVDSMPTRNVSKSGSTKYESRCYVTLTVKDAKTKDVIVRTRLTGSGSDLSDVNKAQDAAMMTIGSDLTGFLDEFYKVHGNILSIDEVKNNKAQVVTIDVGSESSIHGKMNFHVYNANKEQIGELEVKEITSSTTTACKVKKGAEAIKTAIENNERLTVKSHKLNAFLEIFVFEKKTSRLTDKPAADRNKKHTLLYIGSSGDSEVLPYLDKMVMNEIVATQRLYGLSIDQYNQLSAEKRNSLAIDGLAYAISGIPNVKSEAREGYTSHRVEAKQMFVITDALTGEVLYAGDEYALGSSTESRAKAFSKAFKSMSLFDFAIDNAWPIDTKIATIDEVNKKKAKTVTIPVGSNSSIYGSMRLYVYTQNGDGIWNEIGELKVKKIVDADNTTCSVKNGGEEIMKAMEEGADIRVVTRPKSFLGGILKM